MLTDELRQGICGRCFRTFSIVNDFNREAISIEIDLNLPSQRVLRVLSNELLSSLPNLM
ncbi:Transposase [Enterobacter hormaechei]|nr:hypothetical protein AZZ90_003660 [Enterobacter hormaechei]RAL75807.1 hypothetical protein CSC35_4366 [Enterobacter hormaechei]CZZ80805.1 Transposase [Enterobacter hormaechei]SAE28374.1 Transposase [Enterobacter hormaechei]